MTHFTYLESKDRRVLISWRGRQLVILKGARAERFVAEAEELEGEKLQLLLARVTGNFKRGNERRDTEK